MPMYPLTLPFYFNPAQHQHTPNRTLQITLKPLAEVPRNARQQKLLGAASGRYDTSALETIGTWYLVDDAAQEVRSINDEPIFRKLLFLFNVIVALEWQPTPAMVQQIRVAARHASNFLYDVTDGYMAFGQVLIAGPELMEAADIQVMASNRLHPRAWVDALSVADKFKPIRIGRGMWQKNRGILSTWDSPEGYRALVHEWGHYAFGMADRYLTTTHLSAGARWPRLWDAEARSDDSATSERTATMKGNKPASKTMGLDVATPEIAVSVETIMANNEISEFADSDYVFCRIFNRYIVPVLNDAHVADDTKQRLRSGDHIFAALASASEGNTAFTSGGSQQLTSKLLQERDSALIDVEIKQLISERRLSGPQELPLPLPDFPAVPATAGAEHGHDTRLDVASMPAQAHQASKAGMAPRDGAPREYPLAEESHWVYVLKPPFDEHGMPARIIAQGKVAGVDTKRGFALLGGEPGDQVIVVSDAAGVVSVRRGVLAGSAPAVQEWQNVTPACLRDGFMFVDVVPQKLSDSASADQRHAMLRVRVDMANHTAQPNTVSIYPSGVKLAEGLTWDPQSGLSQPVAVSHLDGHVLLRWGAPGTAAERLFLCSYSQGGGPSTSGGGRPSITAGSSEGNAMLFFLGPDVYGAPESVKALPTGDTGVRVVTTVLPAHAAPAQPELPARSYIFTLASNMPLNEYTATLVLYYDRGAPKQGGDLLIYRWNHGSWQQLATIAPVELAYVALPVSAQIDTAPNLMPKTRTAQEQTPAELHVERYCIFWVAGHTI